MSMNVDGINCLECGQEMGEAIDATYSNTGRSLGAVEPSHTGDIFKCETCDYLWLNNFITGEITRWKG